MTAVRWLGPILLAVGLMLAAYFAPRASAAEPLRWQVIECKPGGQDCHPRGKPLSTEIACTLDAWSYGNAAEAGTRYRCERVAR